MEKIIQNMLAKESHLSAYACKSEDGKRFKEDMPDIRSTFFRDTDKIIYALSYARYMDKTQVFTYRRTDHVTKRMLHVQLVSKIARTIGRALSLNEDLIEAAALGHDLGHVPFGHVGEIYLDEISQKHNEGFFKHNIHSVRLLMNIENYGKGLNITYQVLDAIMCHNGEILDRNYAPKEKTIEEFLNDYNSSYKGHVALVPNTLEGCVVRISDFIAYIGRDLDDGISLGLINKESIPEEIKTLLGNSTKDIVNNIIMDVVNNSINKPYIKISDEIYEAIQKLKSFNFENIYYKAYTDEERKHIKSMFNTLFEKYVKDIKENNDQSVILKKYLVSMSDEYKKNTPERIALDYIAGMTDDYFLKQYNLINKNIIKDNTKKEVLDGI